MNAIVDRIKSCDHAFILNSFHTWNLDCHGFQDEKAWRVMADLACSNTDHLETVVIRDAGQVLCFIIAVTDPGTFWPLFLARLGIGSLLKRIAGSFRQTLNRKLFGRKESQASSSEPVDEEFAQLARNSYRTEPGVAQGFFSYVDPAYRKPPTALMMYHKLFKQLQNRGFERLEGQIRFGNEDSVDFHRALGYDIRNAGFCYHAVKLLTKKKSQ